MARQQQKVPAFVDPGERAEQQEQDQEQGTGQTTTEAAAEEGRVPNFEPPEDPPFPESEEGDAPAWAQVPGDLKIPAGVEVGFFLFKASWTANRAKGDRVCIVWPLTDRDERVALTRCTTPLMASSELAKQMIRSFDGMKADWGAAPGRPGSVDTFWDEIGPKCRGLLKRYHGETHSMKPGELAYFFGSCVQLRVGG